MADIRPFRALRYDFDRYDGDLSAVIAPPYDVLDQADKDALLAKDPHNIVAVDLPFIPPKQAGPAKVYADAQATLADWQVQGVLLREARPALYRYDQTFEDEGKSHTRHQFIARVRLQEFSDVVVVPHEQTFGGPKEDRLALTKATRCNVSPVFGLYTDPDNAVGKAFAPAAKARPDATARLDGVLNELWVVTDEAIIDQVHQHLAPKKIYIADGHHRYGTALNYRRFLEETGGAPLPQDHPANYVMLVLASMDDPGCIIQGYCRVLVGNDVSAAALTSAWAEGVAEASEAEANLIVYDGASQAETCLKFTNRAALGTLAAERSPAWRQLDVAYLHHYLIDKLTVEKLGRAPEIRYVRSVAEARQLAEDQGGVAVLPKPTPMAQLRDVGEAGELMPQKSTFFYPKLATGLTINPLAEQ